MKYLIIIIIIGLLLVSGCQHNANIFGKEARDLSFSLYDDELYFYNNTPKEFEEIIDYENRGRIALRLGESSKFGGIIAIEFNQEYILDAQISGINKEVACPRILFINNIRNTLRCFEIEDNNEYLQKYYFYLEARPRQNSDSDKFNVTMTYIPYRYFFDTDMKTYMFGVEDSDANKKTKMYKVTKEYVIKGTSST